MIKADRRPRELARKRQLFVLELIQYCASTRSLSRHAPTRVRLFLLCPYSATFYKPFARTATSDVRGA